MVIHARRLVSCCRALSGPQGWVSPVSSRVLRLDRIAGHPSLMPSRTVPPGGEVVMRDGQLHQCPERLDLKGHL